MQAYITASLPRTNAWETTLYKPCLCLLSFLSLCGVPLFPPPPIHLLGLCRVPRLQIPRTTWFLHAVIHIFTQEAFIEHLLRERHCSWLQRPSPTSGLILVGSEWEGMEGLRESGRGHPVFLSSGKLALISPPPIVWSPKMRGS